MTQMSPTTHLSTGLGCLCDEEILTEHGALLWEAIQAFATDPSYFTEMAIAATEVEAMTCSCGRWCVIAGGLWSHQKSCPGGAEPVD